MAVRLSKSGMLMCLCVVFFFQAEDGIRDLVRSRGLGDVYKRQGLGGAARRVVLRVKVQGDPLALVVGQRVPFAHLVLSLIHI